MTKPRLTAKVMRGLLVLVRNSAAVEILNGVSEFAEHTGSITRAELADARAAHGWIYRMMDYFRGPSRVGRSP